MSTVTLQLPDHIVELLRARATNSGRSLEQEAERWLISSVESEEMLRRETRELREELVRQGVTTSEEFINAHKRDGLK